MSAPPTNVQISEITSTTATINWDGVGLFYRVYLNGSLSTTVVAGFKVYNAYGLTPSTIYSVTITSSSDNVNYTDPSVPVNFATAPPIPVVGATTSITSTTATINWTASTGVFIYKIYLNGNEIAQLGSTATSYTATGLNPGTKYIPSVSAANTISSSLQGVGPIFITIPSAPVVNATTNFGPTTATINWNPVTGAIGYRVYRDSTLVATISADTTSYNLTGLSPSTTYTPSVSATADNANWGAQGTGSAFTTAVAGVSAITQTSSTTTSINVTVTPGEGVISGAVTSPDGGSVGGAGPTYTISGLLPGSQYRIIYSPNSGEAVHIDGLTTPPAPTNFKAKASGNLVTLSWDPVTIAGSPYLVITGDPVIPSQPLYPAYPAGSTYTLANTTPEKLYSIGLQFGQDNLFGSEGDQAVAIVQNVNFGINFLFSP